MAAYDARFGNIEARLGEMEGRLGHVEGRLAGVEAKLGMLTWAVGINIAATLAVLAKLLTR